MTTCPFCGNEPFHYVDNGLGMEAVADDCCELGYDYFMGNKFTAPETVTICWDDFMSIAGKLMRGRRSEVRLSDAVEILMQAQSCIMHETPEDMTSGEAEDDTLSKIREFLNV